MERDVERVLDDVKDGFVSAESALEQYGVVVDPVSLTVDKSETSAKREEIANARGKTKLFPPF